ncbi:EamA family transporter [Nocardia ninae]
MLLAFGAGVLWASYILLSAALGERTSGGGGLAIAMAFGGVLMAPLGVVDAGRALLESEVLTMGFAVAMLSSVLPYSVELEALRRIPPRVFGVLMSLEPAVAALAGLIVLGQFMNIPQWVGVICVVAASAGATRTAEKC